MTYKEFIYKILLFILIPTTPLIPSITYMSVPSWIKDYINWSWLKDPFNLQTIHNLKLEKISLEKQNSKLIEEKEILAKHINSTDYNYKEIIIKTSILIAIGVAIYLTYNNFPGGDSSDTFKKIIHNTSEFFDMVTNSVKSSEVKLTDNNTQEIIKSITENSLSTITDTRVQLNQAKNVVINKFMNIGTLIINYISNNVITKLDRMENILNKITDLLEDRPNSFPGIDETTDTSQKIIGSDDATLE